MVTYNICNSFIKGNESLEEYFNSNKTILEKLYFIPKKVDRIKFDIKNKEFLANINRMQQYYQNINIEEEIKECIETFEKELNISIGSETLYLIIGYNTTTIYSTSYNDKNVTVLLLESTKDLDYLKMLLAHEITHWIRAKAFNHDIFEKCIGERFITEGIACNYSREIIKNKEDSYYCIVPSDTVNWCKSNINFLGTNIKEHLNDNSKMYDFFYMFAKINFPVRTGYVYGYLKVKEYLEKNKLKIKDIINIEWQKIFD